VRALLLIADIGGYTKFMTVHRINLAHAQHVVAQLLEAVIDAAEPTYALAKIEGDAAFFYAKLSDTPKDGELSAFSERVVKIRQAFLDRREEMAINRVCTCDGCVQAGDLTLKFVAHLGEIVLQKVKRYTELAGVDVITVHRFLKNSVQIREYVLMSAPVYQRLDGALRQFAEPGREQLEGLGEVDTYVVDLLKAMALVGKAEPSRLRAFLGWVKMTWRSLPYLLGLKKSCDGFKMLPSMAGAGSPEDSSRTPAT
jgi:hypothetical protein